MTMCVIACDIVIVHNDMCHHRLIVVLHMIAGAQCMMMQCVMFAMCMTCVGSSEQMCSCSIGQKRKIDTAPIAVLTGGTDASSRTPLNVTKSGPLNLIVDKTSSSFSNTINSTTAPVRSSAQPFLWPFGIVRVLVHSKCR